MVQTQNSNLSLSAILACALLLGTALGCSADDPVDNQNGGADVNQTENGDAGDATGDVSENGDTGADTGDVGDAGDEDADVDDNGDNGDNGDAGDNGDDPPEGMELVPEGTYTRGCNLDLDDECNDEDALGNAYDHENPPHDVELSAFYIDRTEVTEAEYEDCVDAGACDEPYHQFAPTDDDGNGADYPVVNVTSEQAITYCEWADKRLPTEAEWEKAARGTDQRIFPWGNDEPDCTKANYDECDGEIMEVGQHPDGASPYELQDMAGNVRNWTADWFDPDYYDEDTDVDPQGPDSGDTRAVRGGSFAWGASFMRTSARYTLDEPPSGGPAPESPFEYDLGFRCAQSVD